MHKIMRLLLVVLAMAVTAMTIASAAGRRVAPSDTIQIHVLNQPDLDTQVRVAPDGTISFPYAGRFRAAGLTEDEVAARIRAGLARAGILRPGHRQERDGPDDYILANSSDGGLTAALSARPENKTAWQELWRRDAIDNCRTKLIL